MGKKIKKCRLLNNILIIHLSQYINRRIDNSKYYKISPFLISRNLLLSKLNFANFLGCEVRNMIKNNMVTQLQTYL
jgi:hypothetical protein